MYQDFMGVPKLLKPRAEYTVETPSLSRPNLLKRHWDLLRIVVGEQSHHPQHRAMSIILLFIFATMCSSCFWLLSVGGFCRQTCFAALPQADQPKREPAKPLAPAKARRVKMETGGVAGGTPVAKAAA